MTAAQLAGTYRIIAVEGVDGTGKTALVNWLRAEHAFTVIHCARTPADVDLVTRHRQILVTPGLVALDRCFVSELVYGPLYRGRSRLTWDDALGLTRTLATGHGVFVHLTAATATIRRRLLARDGSSPSPEALDELSTAYERVFTALTPHAPVVRIDTTRSDVICG